jgi:hypothetical protein
MSAFMVEDTTINIVVNWLWRELDQFYSIPNKLKELGFDTTKPGWVRKLGKAMFQLNIDGVDARYGSGEAAKFRKLDYEYQLAPPAPLAQVLKSLQCWLYQCNEGDVPETELYKLFDDDIRLFLMNIIIAASPEYRRAEWG